MLMGFCVLMLMGFCGLLQGFPAIMSEGAIGSCESALATDFVMPTQAAASPKIGSPEHVLRLKCRAVLVTSGSVILVPEHAFNISRIHVNSGCGHSDPLHTALPEPNPQSSADPR